jgi:hypothetical protein
MLTVVLGRYAEFVNRGIDRGGWESRWKRVALSRVKCFSLRNCSNKAPTSTVATSQLFKNNAAAFSRSVSTRNPRPDLHLCPCITLRRGDTIPLDPRCRTLALSASNMQTSTQRMQGYYLAPQWTQSARTNSDVPKVESIGQASPRQAHTPAQTVPRTAGS